MKEKIFIAGAGGMLGEAFYNVFKINYELKCTDIDLNEQWLELLDFRKKKNYFEEVNSFKPDYLFHLGAYTDLEYCEQNEEDTYLTNTESVKYAVEISNNLNIPLLYISTAGIFDGSKETFDESDSPNPQGIYAKSKFFAERFVQENSKKYLICRAGWMMGGGPKKDKKFISKILKQIEKGSKEIFVVDDKLGTPTYTYDFAYNTKQLLKFKKWGLYNMVCQNKTSRYEVAKEVIKILNLENKIKVTKVKSDYFSKTYFAPRPSSEILINKNLAKIKMDMMRSWKITLKEYLNTYFNRENNAI